MAVKVSLIVVTWNGLKHTQLFLWSLRRWTKWPYHLIFVDNNSRDGTRSFLREQKEIELITNSKNIGYGAAVNQATARIKTDYFCLLNNDLVLSPGWLTKMMTIFQTRPRLGQLTTNSNCIIDENKPLKHVSFASWQRFKKKHQHWSPRRLWQEYYGDWLKFILYNQRRHKNKLDYIKAPSGFMGGWCLLMRRSILAKIGPRLYDPRFQIAFWEDVDLSWRIGLAGYRLAVAREIFLHHYTNASSQRLNKKEKETVAKNKERLFEKWEKFFLKYLKEKTGAQEEKLRRLKKRDYIFQCYLSYLGFRTLLNRLAQINH